MAQKWNSSRAALIKRMYAEAKAGLLAEMLNHHPNATIVVVAQDLGFFSTAEEEKLERDAIEIACASQPTECHRFVFVNTSYGVDGGPGQLLAASVNATIAALQGCDLWWR